MRRRSAMTSTPAFLRDPDSDSPVQTGKCSSPRVAPARRIPDDLDCRSHPESPDPGLRPPIRDQRCRHTERAVRTVHAGPHTLCRGRLRRCGANGPLPGTSIPNPTSPPSSPIFSSVLAIHLSSRAEQTTEEFAMTLLDQQALASGQPVWLSSGETHQRRVGRQVAEFHRKATGRVSRQRRSPQIPSRWWELATSST